MEKNVGSRYLEGQYVVNGFIFILTYYSTYNYEQRIGVINKSCSYCLSIDEPHLNGSIHAFRTHSTLCLFEINSLWLDEALWGNHFYHPVSKATTDHKSVNKLVIPQEL